MKYQLSKLEEDYLKYDEYLHELETCEDGDRARELRSKARALRARNAWATTPEALRAEAKRIRERMVRVEGKDTPATSAVSNDS